MAGLSGWMGLAARAEGQPQAEATTNAPQPAAASSSQPLRSRPTSDPLKSLEDSLGATFGDFSRSKNQQPARLPPPTATVRPAVPNKQLQQELQRRKEWVFMTPEELIVGADAKDPSKSSTYGLEGKELERMSPMERYYLKQNHPEISSLTPSPATDRSPFTAKESERGLTQSQKEAQLEGVKEGIMHSSKAGLGNWADSSSPFAGHPVVSDLFTQSKDKSFVDEQSRAHDDYRQRYQEILNGSSPASSTSPLNDLTSLKPAMQASTASTGLPASSQHRPDGYDPLQGRASSTYIPKPTDVNDAPLHQWDPLYAPQAPEPPKKFTPSSPVFTFPRRVIAP